MHPARRGPYHKCGEVFGAGVVEQNVHRKFGAGLDAVAVCIGSGAEVSERHGEVQRLQVFQSLVSGRPVGEGELAEGGHRYGVVSVARSALSRRVLYNAPASIRSFKKFVLADVSIFPRATLLHAGTAPLESVPI